MGINTSVYYTSLDGDIQSLQIAIITVITEHQRFRVSSVGNKHIGMLSVPPTSGNAQFDIVGQDEYGIKVTDNYAAAVKGGKLYPFVIKKHSLTDSDTVMQVVGGSVAEVGKITYDDRSDPTRLDYICEMAALLLYLTAE